MEGRDWRIGLDLVCGPVGGHGAALGGRCKRAVSRMRRNEMRIKFSLDRAERPKMCSRSGAVDMPFTTGVHRVILPAQKPRYDRRLMSGSRRIYTTLDYWRSCKSITILPTRQVLRFRKFSTGKLLGPSAARTLPVKAAGSCSILGLRIRVTIAASRLRGPCPLNLRLTAWLPKPRE